MSDEVGLRRTLPRRRVTNLDVSRGIAIILMVVGHSVTAVENTSLGVSPIYATANAIFHTTRMPLFFFLAGTFLIATLRKSGYGSWVVDKAQYLLYPWLVWSVLRGLIEVGFFELGIGGRITFGEVVYGVVWEPRIWYLPALFVAFAVIGGAYTVWGGRQWWQIPAWILLLGLIYLTANTWWPPLLLVHPFSIFMLLGVGLSAWTVRASGMSRRAAVIVVLISAVLYGAARSPSLLARISE